MTVSALSILDEYQSWREKLKPERAKKRGAVRLKLDEETTILALMMDEDPTTLDAISFTYVPRNEAGSLIISYHERKATQPPYHLVLSRVIQIGPDVEAPSWEVRMDMDTKAILAETRSPDFSFSPAHEAVLSRWRIAR